MTLQKELDLFCKEHAKVLEEGKEPNKCLERLEIQI